MKEWKKRINNIVRWKFELSMVKKLEGKGIKKIYGS